MRGLNAGRVIDVENGTCEEHAAGTAKEPARGFRLSADPRASRPLVSLGMFIPRPIAPAVTVVTKPVTPVAQAPPKSKVALVMPKKPLPTLIVVDEAVVEDGVERVKKLGKRALRILELVSKGLSNAQIAVQIGTTEGSIGAHMPSINRAIGISALSRKLKRDTAAALYRRYIEKYGEANTLPEPAGVEAKPDDVAPIVVESDEVPRTPTPGPPPVDSGEKVESPETPIQEVEMAAPVLPAVGNVILETTTRIVDPVDLLDEGLKRILRLCADGLDNNAIARKCGCKYGAVASGMSMIYKMLGISHIVNMYEKRDLAGDIYRKHLESKGGAVPAVSLGIPSVEKGVVNVNKDLPELKRRLEDIIRSAEAALKLIS